MTQPIGEVSPEWIEAQTKALYRLLAKQGITEEHIETLPEVKESVDRMLGFIQQGMRVPALDQVRQRQKNKAKRERKKHR
jgi:predicted deacylase